VFKHWNRLPKEAAESPLLETFKHQLDLALGSLLWLTLLCTGLV